MQTPDKDWRLGLCAGAGIGIAVLVVPRAFVIDPGILVASILAIPGFLAGLVVYSFLFLRRPSYG